MSKEEASLFDLKSASWDSDPLRLKLAREISQTIALAVGLNQDMDVMDFGCGTGLVALQLHPLVRSVTGYDSSRGMLDVFEKKIVQSRLSGVEARFFDHHKDTHLDGRYHLVIASMTLHHVRDVDQLLAKLYDVLHPGGTLCIADLDREDGRFHDDNEGIFHFGFDHDVLGDNLRLAGFMGVRTVKATDIVKTGKDGIERLFSIFLMSARKR